MSTKDEALKLALEALKTYHYAMIDAGVLDRQEVLNQGFTAATAIREALAEQPAQSTADKSELETVPAKGGLLPAQQGCMRCNTPKKCALYGCSPLTWPAEQPAQQPNEADDLIRNLGFDPEQFRTEAGFINHMKLRAAIQHPEEYRAAMQPMYQKLTNCVLCGRLNPKEGVCDHGVEQPAQQEPVECANGCRGFFKHHPPAQRKPLTDEQIDAIGAKIFSADFLDVEEVHANRDLARAIEAAHGIKGNA